MKRLSLILSVLVACMDPNTAPPDLQQTIEAKCGPVPLAPGVSVAFQGNLAYMPASDWFGIDQWRADTEVWTNCIQGL